MSPTNWIIADNDLVHAGDHVRLDDGRDGIITRVARDQHGQLDWRGWPEIQLAGGELMALHPMRIASRAVR